jgi:hypothetical protein
MDVLEAVLPSGRCVRWEKVTTKLFLAAQDRASEKAGDSKSKFGTALAKELVLECLRYVTNPLPFPPSDDGSVDVDAMLDKATEQNQWQPTTHMAMITADGPHCFEIIFADLADFLTITELVQDGLSMGRRDAVRGKTRAASIGQ